MLFEFAVHTEWLAPTVAGLFVLAFSDGKEHFETMKRSSTEGDFKTNQGASLAIQQPSSNTQQQQIITLCNLPEELPIWCLLDDLFDWQSLFAHKSSVKWRCDGVENACLKYKLRCRSLKKALFG
ncbi:uncharacterized protein MEPE_01719 [Melanopsichium pennsylvanicum]|uniref:Uncharacterized protein n=1 Tax=Melanopsichium pennsylvanicum TaxID=63383 RepID=A0AAJ4XJ05_9BASI|nr:uncharacterized protein MEPE_01719 [Melanopsichium pennsylvanicum]